MADPVPPDPVLPEVAPVVAALVVLEPVEDALVPPDPVLPEVVPDVAALVVLEPVEDALVPPDPVLPEVVPDVAALVVLAPAETDPVAAELVPTEPVFPELAPAVAVLVVLEPVEDVPVEDAPVEPIDDVPSAPVVASVELVPPVPAALEYGAASDSGLPQAAARKRGSVTAPQLTACFGLINGVLMSFPPRYTIAAALGVQRTNHALLT